MRKVVDSNALRSPALEHFLVAKPLNIAVVSDYIGVEIHKKSPLITVRESMSMLCRFPGQVLILKGTSLLCGVDGRTKGLRRRLIDEKQTNAFPAYCRHLRALKTGNLHLQRQVLNLGRDAEEVIRSIEAGIPNVTEGIALVARLYSSDERARIRADEPLSAAIVDKLVQSAMTIAAISFADDPRIHTAPRFEELINLYTFRFALCASLLALRWGSHGGAASARPDRVRNDLIDLHFAVCATYFDGLISEDNKAQNIYQQAREIIRLMQLT